MVAHIPGKAQSQLLENFETDLLAWTVIEGKMSISTEQAYQGTQSLLMETTFLNRIEVDHRI